MKKLLVYFSVLVGCLFIGLTTYYFVKDYDEFIISRGDETGVFADNSYNLNVGETATLKVEVNKQSDDTEVLYSFETDGVATYDLETGVITAVKGGTTKLKIYSNKESLGFFEYDIAVGDGSDTNGWFIRNKEDLKAIGTGSMELGHNYELIADIDLENEEWAPIGGEIDELNNIKYFAGKFNGNQHTIKNLTVTTDGYYAGLFGAIGEMAEISNLKIDGVNISGYYYFGGALAGLSYGSTVERVQITNANFVAKANSSFTLEAGQNLNNIGGIVGANFAYQSGDIVNHSKISLSTFSGTIKIAVADPSNETTFNLGGIVGANCGGEIHNNKATVDFEIDSVIANNENESKCSVGGIIGMSYIHNPNSKEFTTNKDNEVVYAIVMNNLAIINFDNATARMGGVIGHNAIPTVGKIIPEDSAQELKDTVKRMQINVASRVAGNFYASKSTSSLTKFYAGCVEKGIEELKNIQTFKDANWSISESANAAEETPAWIIVDGTSIAEVNLDGVNEKHLFSTTVIELNQDNFASYIEKMMDNSNVAVQKYWLSREYKLVSDIDLSTIYPVWTPISYRDSDPTFSGVFDGNGHVIKNVNIVNIANAETNELKSEVVGFFASIGTTGIVRNIKFETVKIDMAKYAGAIAGINLGLIENCQVVNVEIKDAIQAGFVVGYNKGIIKTTNTVEVPVETLDSTEATETETYLQYTVLSGEIINTIESKNKDNSTFIGGIAGYNIGKIIGTRIEGEFKLLGEKIISGSTLKMFGGIAGYNGGEIISSSVEDGKIEDMSTIFTYIGGIAGINNGLIEKCGVGSNFYFSINAEINKANNIVGGIAGQLSVGATIKQCFVRADMSAFYVGGIAANLFGEVSECYVLGTIKGQYVGGISVNVSLTDKQTIGGYVADCYVKADLAGNTSTSVVAGLSTFLVHPGKFERVIVSATFSGSGDKYYESCNDTRTSFYNFINSFAGTKLGKVYNIIVDDTISADKIKKNGGAINYEGQSVYYLSSEEINNPETYSEKGFSIVDGGIWLITGDKFPELRNVNFNGIYQNEESASETPIETPSETPETPATPEDPSGTPETPETPEDPSGTPETPSGTPEESGTPAEETTTENSESTAA